MKIAEDSKQKMMNSSRGFWEELASKNPNDEHIQGLARLRNRMEQMPADVMAAMFRPTTAAELHNFCHR